MRKEGIVNFAVGMVVGVGGVATYGWLRSSGPLFREVIIGQIAWMIPSTEANTETGFSQTIFPIHGGWKFSGFVANLLAEQGTPWKETGLNPQSPLAERRSFLVMARPADPLLKNFSVVSTEEEPTGFGRAYNSKKGVSVSVTTTRYWLVRNEHLEMSEP